MTAAMSFEAAHMTEDLAPTSPPSMAGAEVDSNALDSMLEKSRKAAGYLCLLLHAKVSIKTWSLLFPFIELGLLELF